MERSYPNLWDFGKATRAGRSMRWARRGQRPGLPRCGNGNSSIIFFAPMKLRPEMELRSRQSRRAGLICSADAWKYAGEIETLML